MLRGAISVTTGRSFAPYGRVVRGVRSGTGFVNAVGGGGAHHTAKTNTLRDRNVKKKTHSLRWRSVNPLRSQCTQARRHFVTEVGSTAVKDDGCAASDPGKKKPVEETFGAENLPRGTVGGVQWASSRVLQLDKNAPQWWHFPHENGKPNRSTVLGKTFDRLNEQAFDPTFANSEWQTFIDPNLRVPQTPPPQLLSIAPMMEYTTPHFRHLVRLLTKKTWLYTEMEVDQTLFHTDHPRLDRYLDFPIEGHPSSLQLGGSDPELLAIACSVAAPYGYDEINLNCGCPSPKVAGNGNFGASLMYDASQVAECINAMSSHSGGAPVTVKCRIGVDDFDSYDTLCQFIETVSEQMKGCPSASNRPFFAIHARKALLNGLSPAENRTVPPLRYEWVYGLANEFPEIAFALNGGIVDLHTAAAIAKGDGKPGSDTNLSLLGTMIGRQSHADPWGLLATADVDVFGDDKNPETSLSRRKLLEAYGEYCDATRGRFGTTKDGYQVPSIRHLVHPLQNLFYGEPNAKRWRRAMDEALKKDSKNEAKKVSELIFETLRDGGVSDETLDAPPELRRRRKPNGVIMGDSEFEEFKEAQYQAAVDKLKNLPTPPRRGELKDD